MIFIIFWDAVKTSLKTKLVLSYLLIIMIPIGISGMFLSRYINETVKKDYLNVVNGYLQQVDYNISEKIKMSANTIEIIRLNRSIEHLFNSDHLSDAFIISTIVNDLVPNLESIKAQNSLIYRINIFHGNTMIPNVTEHLYYDQSINDGHWEKKISFFKNNNRSLRSNIFIEYKEAESIRIQNSQPKRIKVFSIYHPFYSYYADKILGVIEVQILADSLLMFLAENKNPKIYDIVNVIDQNNILLYSNNSNMAPLSVNDVNNSQNHMSYYSQGVKYQVVKHYIDSIKAWFVVYIPENSIYFNNHYKVIIIVVTIAIITTLGIISYVLSKLILRNLTELSNGINKIKRGELGTKIKIQSNDELGVISRSFNNMTEHIQMLMVDLENSFKIEKENIYKVIENQIQPHFMCNALDMIRMTAENNHMNDLSHATSLLMNYLMYNISKKQTYVCLKDELNNVLLTTYNVRILTVSSVRGLTENMAANL